MYLILVILVLIALPLIWYLLNYLIIKTVVVRVDREGFFWRCYAKEYRWGISGFWFSVSSEWIMSGWKHKEGTDKNPVYPKWDEGENTRYKEDETWYLIRGKDPETGEMLTYKAANKEQWLSLYGERWLRFYINALGEIVKVRTL